MTKRFKAKYSVCKNIKGKFKNIWGVVKAAKFRSVRILKRNATNVNRQQKKLSSFGKYLHTKQCLKNYYTNLREKQFQSFLMLAKNSKSKTIDKFISLLESRLDTVLYRACFVNSLFMARQLINHGFVYVNSKRIKSCNFLLKKDDIIEIKYKSRFINLIRILKQRRFRANLKLVSQQKVRKDFFLDLAKTLNKKTRIITYKLRQLLYKANKSKFVVQRYANYPLQPSNLEVNFKLFKIVYLSDNSTLEKVYYPFKLRYKKHKNSVSYSYNEFLQQK
jgi:small subunit ribosomal protein S4